MWRILLEFTAAVLAALLFVVLVLPFGASDISHAATASGQEFGTSADANKTSPKISSNLNKQK